MPGIFDVNVDELSLNSFFVAEFSGFRLATKKSGNKKLASKKSDSYVYGKRNCWKVKKQILIALFDKFRSQVLQNDTDIEAI